MMRKVRFGAVALALALAAVPAVAAKVVLTPGAKPTEIEAGRQPFAFAHRRRSGPPLLAMSRFWRARSPTAIPGGS